MQIIVCFGVTVRRFVRGYLCLRSSYFSEMLFFTSKATLCHTAEDHSGHIIDIFLYYFCKLWGSDAGVFECSSLLGCGGMSPG